VRLVAHNLLRAAGSLASLAYAKACGATIRRDLIDVAARTARHGHGQITLHLLEGWRREHEWLTLFITTCAGRPGSEPERAFGTVPPTVPRADPRRAAPLPRFPQ